jgi:hypothetical protein
MWKYCWVSLARPKNFAESELRWRGCGLGLDSRSGDILFIVQFKVSNRQCYIRTTRWCENQQWRKLFLQLSKASIWNHQIFNSHNLYPHSTKSNSKIASGYYDVDFYGQFAAADQTLILPWRVKLPCRKSSCRWRIERKGFSGERIY